jgi:sialidase-1
MRPKLWQMCTLLLALLLGIPATILWLNAPADPVYEGIHLSTYLFELYGPSPGGKSLHVRQQANNALVKIGVQGAPLLANWLETEPSGLLDRLEALLRKYFAKVRITPNARQEIAFQALNGIPLKGAARAIEAYLLTPNGPTIRTRATVLLMFRFNSAPASERAQLAAESGPFVSKLLERFEHGAPDEYALALLGPLFETRAVPSEVDFLPRVRQASGKSRYLDRALECLERSASGPKGTFDLFLAGTGAYQSYRIPAMVKSPRGTALAFCEGRKAGSSDSGAIDLLLKRSTDQGRTWSEQKVIWTDKRNTCGNPAPVVDETSGFIWLLMTWNNGTDSEQDIQRGTSVDTRRVFITHSEDDGITWKVPVEITDSVKSAEWGWYATGPGNGIQLTRGNYKDRIIVPANHSEAGKGTHMTRSHVVFSDDHGSTWQIGGVEEEKTNESALVERADGSLLHDMRSYHGQHRRAIATSSDGGATWSLVKFDDALTEPVCQASILRYTWPGPNEISRILFANPASVKRENLTIRLSYDEAATWPVSKVIYSGPAAYSSLARLSDGTILCLFESGERSPYERISLARFSLDWLEGSK